MPPTPQPSQITASVSEPTPMRRRSTWHQVILWCPDTGPRMVGPFYPDFAQAMWNADRTPGAFVVTIPPESSPPDATTGCNPPEQCKAQGGSLSIPEPDARPAVNQTSEREWEKRCRWVQCACGGCDRLSPTGKFYLTLGGAWMDITPHNRTIGYWFPVEEQKSLEVLSKAPPPPDAQEHEAEKPEPRWNFERARGVLKGAPGPSSDEILRRQRSQQTDGTSGVVADMCRIITSATADDDEKASAFFTLEEALRPILKAPKASTPSSSQSPAAQSKAEDGLRWGCRIIERVGGLDIISPEGFWYRDLSREWRPHDDPRRNPWFNDWSYAMVLAVLNDPSTPLPPDYKQPPPSAPSSGQEGSKNEHGSDHGGARGDAQEGTSRLAQTPQAGAGEVAQDQGQGRAGRQAEVKSHTTTASHCLSHDEPAKVGNALPEIESSGAFCIRKGIAIPFRHEVASYLEERDQQWIERLRKAPSSEVER